MTRSDWVVLRPGPGTALRMERRVLHVLLLLTAAILVVLVLSAAMGEQPIAPGDAVRTMLGLQTASGVDHGFVVNVLRVPRALVAVAVGMGLGASGAILQGLTRNPLAAPSVLGITQGAGFAAVATVVGFAGTRSELVGPMAFAGAATATLLLYLFARRGGASANRLILVGIGIAAIAAALTAVVVTFGNIYQVQSALVWLVGSVRARGWPDLWRVLPWLLVLLPVAMLSARTLNSLTLGDQVASGLGARVEAQRGLLLFTSAGLAGAAVAVAGTIGFVGLMSPHLARRLVGPAHEGAIPAAALFGGLIVAAADLLGRTAVAPIEVPCGIVTAILGAPYFLYLLYREGTA